MTDRLNELIKSVDTADFFKTRAPGVTGEQVRNIIEFGHIHFSPAYPGMPVSSETALVTMPDHSVHTIQITVDEPGSPKNHLCCVTCYTPKNRVHCAAAVAAMVKKLSEMPAPKKKMSCPGCGEEIEPATAIEDYGLMGTR